jgi:selenide,water dikinase
MLFFGRKKRLIDYASAGRPGKVPEGLAQALTTLSPPVFAGDTAFYHLTDELAFIQAVDIFPPVVNDPFTFGQIAAAHVLGAVYATGATPRIGMPLVSFPEDHEAALGWLADILRGGAERFQLAKTSLGGCHAARDTEIKFGFAVTATIDPQKLVTPANAKAGDKLVLTKALGTGVVTAAHRGDTCPEDLFQAASASMIQLNDIGRDAMLEVGAHAAAVVGSQGLAGAAQEMAQNGRATVIVELAQVPVFAGAEKLARKPTRSGTAHAAESAAGLRKEGKPEPHRMELFHDPQTSGGLLLSVPVGEAEILVQKCRGRGAVAAAIIGEVVECQDVEVIVRA